MPSLVLLRATQPCSGSSGLLMGLFLYVIWGVPFKGTECVSWVVTLCKAPFFLGETGAQKEGVAAESPVLLIPTLFSALPPPPAWLSLGSLLGFP